MYHANRRGETSRRVAEHPSEHGANHESRSCATRVHARSNKHLRHYTGQLIFHFECVEHAGPQRQNIRVHACGKHDPLFISLQCERIDRNSLILVSLMCTNRNGAGIDMHFVPD